MLSFIYRILLPFLFLALSCSDTDSIPQANFTSSANPFESYLNLTDEAYSYTKVHQTEGDGYSIHILKMVSQRWLNEELVDEPEWWHWLTIVIPDELEKSKGLIWIGGGSRFDDAPQKINPMLIRAAIETKSITADLHNIPFQPHSFTGDHMEQRNEDDLIAY